MQYFTELHNEEDRDCDREIIYYDEHDVFHDTFYDDDSEMLHAMFDLMARGCRIDFVAYPCIRCISLKKGENDV